MSFNIGQAGLDCCGAGAACTSSAPSVCGTGYCRNPVEVTEGLVSFAVDLIETAPLREWNALALQEVEADRADSCNLDQAAEIADPLWQWGYAARHESVLNDAEGPYGPAIIDNFGFHGASATIVLRDSGVCDGRWEEDDQRRVAMVREIGTDLGVWVINGHWTTVQDPAIARCEAQRLTGYVAASIPEDDVVIVTGDLNIHLFGERGGVEGTERLAAWRALRDELEDAGFRRIPADAHTFPAAVPHSTIDHVFVRDLALRANTAVAHVVAPAWSYPGGVGMLTDHRAVVLDVTLDEGTGVPAALLPSVVAAM